MHQGAGKTGSLNIPKQEYNWAARRQLQCSTVCIMELTDTKQEVKYQYFSIVKPTRCINISNLFYWSNILHVSEGLSIHHQELKTVHTATGISRTDTAVCFLADTCQQADSGNRSGYPLASRQQYLFDICLLQYVQSLTPCDGWKGLPKHVECYSNKINLRHCCIWLVLLQKYITIHGHMNVEYQSFVR